MLEKGREPGVSTHLRFHKSKYKSLIGFLNYENLFILQ